MSRRLFLVLRSVEPRRNPRHRLPEASAQGHSMSVCPPPPSRLTYTPPAVWAHDPPVTRRNSTPPPPSPLEKYPFAAPARCVLVVPAPSWQREACRPLLHSPCWNGASGIEPSAPSGTLRFPGYRPPSTNPARVGCATGTPLRFRWATSFPPAVAVPFDQPCAGWMPPTLRGWIATEARRRTLELSSVIPMTGPIR